VGLDTTDSEVTRGIYKVADGRLTLKVADDGNKGEDAYPIGFEVEKGYDLLEMVINSEE